MVIAGVVSLIAVTVTVASLAWLHVQRTGLSTVRNPVTEYGITPFRPDTALPRSRSVSPDWRSRSASIARSKGTDT
jgi:hypothetical protein